jgi:hypothetical protein
LGIPVLLHSSRNRHTTLNQADRIKTCFGFLAITVLGFEPAPGISVRKPDDKHNRATPTFLFSSFRRKKIIVY